MGSKHSILKHLVDCLPAEINTFRDIFCGSGVVSLNVEAKKYRLTDITEKLIELHLNLSDMNFCSHALDVSNLYLNDKESYYRLRDDYNADPCPAKFLCLIYRSFSNQMRFNRKGEFNLPYGERNIFSWMRIMKHWNFSKNANVEFAVSDFKIELANCAEDDFVFMDPPYYNSVATYNDGWDEDDEFELYSATEKLKCKWIMTNTLENRGVPNPFLEDFIADNDYYVYPINSSFTYDNFRKTDHKKKEVIITNYKV
ncbi:DNA adenine methylase [Paraglaciecola Antarctic GD virus 1]|nr:DNA adenine methylase [Paraglaciecola Antarctic GD virus 1]